MDKSCTTCANYTDTCKRCVNSGTFGEYTPLGPVIKDSGDRREFESGAVRDMQAGKGRCDLLPLLEVADLLQGDPVIKAIHMYQQAGNVESLKSAISIFCVQRDWSYVQAMLELAKHFEQGAKKYGDRNWEKGIPEWAFINSGIRHYLKWLGGWNDEPHDRAVIWNLMCLWWTHEHITEVDDNDTD